MSAFFLYRDDVHLDLSATEQVFSVLGASKQFTCGKYRIWYYKKSTDNDFDIAVEGDATAVVVGSLAYTGTQGSSLKNALHDWRDGLLSAENCVGVFALIFIRNNRISIVVDGSGIQNIYYDTECRAVSSSFYALVQALPEQLTLNRDAVVENLVTGILIAPDTIFNEILRYESSARLQFHFEGITTAKLILPPPKLLDVRNRSEMVDLELERLRNRYLILSEHRKSKFGTEEAPFDLGMSGGYDSRLLLLSARETLKTVALHTHWKVKPDTDLQIARKIASTLNLPIFEHEVPKLSAMSQDDLTQLMDDSFLFYDAHIRVNCSLLSHLRSRRYRSIMLNGNSLTLNGVGGELYRNEDRIVGTQSYSRWLLKDVLYHEAPDSFDDKQAEQNCLLHLRNKISAVLSLSGEKIDLAQIKRYYAQVWVPFGPGIIANAHNQLSDIFFPFVDASVTPYALSAVHHLSSYGQFEAEMITKLDPKVAAISSTYGYPFTNLPKNEALKSYIKWYIRPLADMYYERKMKKKKVESNWSQKDSNLEYHKFVSKQLESVMSWNLPVNWNRLFLSTDPFHRAVDFGYLLNKFSSRIKKQV